MRRVRKRERAREGEGGREGERERDKCEEAFVCVWLGGEDEMAGVWEGWGRTRLRGPDRLKMVGLSHNVQ